jgi:hypothetical protein
MHRLSIGPMRSSMQVDPPGAVFGCLLSRNLAGGRATPGMPVIASRRMAHARLTLCAHSARAFTATTS